MPARKRSGTKTPPDRSPKAHVPLPPKKIAPHTGDRPTGEQRIEPQIGQFTGQGAPALEKK